MESELSGKTGLLWLQSWYLQGSIVACRTGSSLSVVTYRYSGDNEMKYNTLHAYINLLSTLQIIIVTTNSWREFLLEKLIVAQILLKFSYGTRRFFAVSREKSATGF